MVALVPVLVGEDFYTALLLQQYGSGMPRYRGSPMLGGSFWSSILSFTKNLAARAAPHVSNLISQAKPHVRSHATRAVESAIDGAVDKVTAKLRDLQEGNRRQHRKRRHSKGIKAARERKRKRSTKLTVGKKSVTRTVKKRKGSKKIRKVRVSRNSELITDKF